MSRITFRAANHLIEAIEARDFDGKSQTGRPPEGSTNMVARRDLGRYYRLLADELRSVNLTEAEASLICYALNGPHLMDVGSLRGLSALTVLRVEVSDAITLNAYDLKWGVNGGELAAKLDALTPGQAMAIIDAVERFWADCATATVHSVGLTKGGEK